MAGTWIGFVWGGWEESESIATGSTSKLGHVLPETAGAKPSPRKLWQGMFTFKFGIMLNICWKLYAVNNCKQLIILFMIVGPGVGCLQWEGFVPKGRSTIWYEGVWQGKRWLPTSCSTVSCQQSCQEPGMIALDLDLFAVPVIIYGWLTSPSSFCQVVLCQKRLKEQHEKDKRIYANMFQKFAERDSKVRDYVFYCSHQSLGNWKSEKGK